MIYLIGIITFISIVLLLISYTLDNKKIKHSRTLKICTLAIVITTMIFTSFYSIKMHLERPVSSDEVIKQAKEVLSKEYPDKIYNAENLSDAEEFTKKSAIDTLTTLLNKVVDSENSVSIKDRYDAIVKDNSTYVDNISKDVQDRYYQVDNFDTDEMKANVSLALLSITNSLLGEDKNIEVKAINIENVYLSKETNTVRIPLDIYTNHYSGYTIDMVFINNHWYIDTYSLMNQVDIISYIQQITKK